MTTITFLATSITLAILFQSSVKEYETHLAETAKSHANLINAVARFNKKYGSNFPEGSRAATIKQIKEGLAPFGGTMELTLAQRKNEKIVFILRQRATKQYEPAPINFISPLAEPMRRALKGISGVMIGLDYRNETVLAAHELSPLLGIGVVVKMDMAEIRAPFLKAGGIAILGTSLLILVGTFLFFRLTNPIIFRLKNSEQLYRTMVEGHSELMCRFQPDGTLNFVNDAYCQYFGKKREDLIGHKFMPMIPPEDQKKIADHLSKLSSTTLTASHEHRVIVPNKGIRWNRWTNKAICDEDGNIVEIISIGHDITDRRHMERTLLAVTECNKALVHTTSEKALLSSICKIIVTIAGYEMAWVGYAQHDSKKSVHKVSQYGCKDSYLDSIHVTWDDSNLGQGPTGTAIRTKKACTTRFIHTDPKFKPWRKKALQQGFKSFIALPVKSKNKILGALNIYSSKADAFDTCEAKLLQKLTDDLAYGILAHRKTKEHHRAEEALKESEWRLRSVTDSTRDAIIAIKSDCSVISWNKGAVEIFGYSEEEMLGEAMTKIIPENMRDAHKAGISRLNKTGKSTLIGKTMELAALRKNGEEFPIELALGSWKGKTETFFSGIIRDITERVKTEGQLRQAQKMDALGNLAGGIAHDLNNMLLPILTLTGMTVRKLPEDTPERERLTKVVQAAEKAQDLVKRILSFSRQEDDVKKENINLYASTMESMGLIHSSLPSSIKVIENIDEDVGHVIADGTQIQTVLLNLASNSADAMKGKTGKIEITLKQTKVTKKTAHEIHGLKPGIWAKLSVKDTGEGMDKKTLNRIFDPFFTTKNVGKGTGLGLSMVHGIIANHGGAIDISSAPDKGTTFHIYLPLAQTNNERKR